MNAPLRPKKKGNMIVWAILGLLALSLTGFGVRSVGRGGVQAVATVGDQKITANEYARALNSRLQALSRQTGTNFTLQQAISFGLDRQVLGQLLASAALDGENSRIGLSIGDKRVRDAVVGNRAFQGAPGKFDEETYKSTLRRVNLKPAEYEEILRKETARAILQSAVTAGIRGSESYALALLRYVGEERGFIWAKVTRAMLDGPTREPTDAEIKAWYDAHPDLYTAPETRRITYIRLSPDMMTDKVKIDEAALRDAYEKQRDRFNIPARRIVDRIVFPTAQQAAAARAEIDSGKKSFDDIVKERGIDPKDAALGEVQRSDLSKAAADKLFAADKPGIIGPVDSALGPALFRIKAVLPGKKTSFEQARTTLAAEYVVTRARSLVEKEMGKIDDLLAGGAELEDAAKETPAELGKIDFTADSHDGIARYDSFRKEALKVAKDDYPSVKMADDGTIFALRLDKIIQPTLIPLDKLRVKVIADWKAEETRKRLRKLAEQMKERIKGGEAFAQQGLLDLTKETLTRDATVKDAPKALVSEIFKAAKGDVIVVSEGDDVVIARLDSIKPFDEKSDKSKKTIASVSQRYGQQLAGDVFQGFANAVETKSGVVINQAVINAVHSSFR